jgi:hypothetical protein
MTSVTPATDWRRVWSRVFLGLLALLLVWTFATAAGGGVEWRLAGLRIRSNNPLRPGLALAALALLYAIGCRRYLVENIDWVARHATRRIGLLASGLALAVGVWAWSQTSLVAGGPDSYGYVSQAYLWLGGSLTIPQPLVQQAPWPFADLSYAPLGYRPAIGGGAIVPTYASGLPLMMALGVLVAGACGPFLIVPMLGALAIWLTYRLGRELWSPWHGLTAALLLAASPTAAFMLMWPMSDIPVMACWLAATMSAVAGGRWRFLRTGLLIALAIPVRPNLVVLVLPFAWWAWRGPLDVRTRLRQVAELALGVLPGVLLVASVHTQLYGAPWRSGYGNFDSLYGWRNLGPNLTKYPRWLLDVETPFVLAMLIPAAAVVRRVVARRPLAEADARVLLLVWVIVGVWVSYLFYIPFQQHEWWYLRFLLPAFPLTLLLAVEGWRLLFARWRPAIAASVVAAVTIACTAHGIRRITTDGIAGIGEGEQTYVRVADFVASRLPPNAMLIAMLHSGTLRYYAGRPTLRYDWLQREWWPRALDVLVQQGFQPFIVVTEWEEPIVRARFGAGAGDEHVLGCLVAQETRPNGARIYDPLRGRWCGPLRIEPVVQNLCRPPLAVPALAGRPAPAGP